MKHNLVLLFAAALATSGTALAADPLQLAQQKQCMACHALDKKVVGPAFKDIAAKYAEHPAATPELVKKVMKGTSGTWGTLAMPANTQVTEAQAAELVNWILQQK